MVSAPCCLQDKKKQVAATRNIKGALSKQWLARWEVNPKLIARGKTF